MATRAERWEAQRKKVLALQPRIRVDRCEVKESTGGVYDVLIEGFGLHSAIAPPQVTVGDIDVVDLRFEKKGRVLRGTLREKPRSPVVVVDYGFARAEGKAEQT